MSEEIKELEESKSNSEFVVDDEFKADWALHKLSKIKTQIDSVKRRAKLQEQQIFDWKTKELQTLEESKQYFETLLQNFMKQKLESDPKYKLSSPFGKLSTRKSKKWSYDDEVLLNEFKNTDLVRSTSKIDKNALKKRIKMIDGKAIDSETGQVVNGVSVSEERKITIKVEENHE